jgi:hypothetical protein
MYGVNDDGQLSLVVLARCIILQLKANSARGVLEGGFGGRLADHKSHRGPRYNKLGGYQVKVCFVARTLRAIVAPAKKVLRLSANQESEAVESHDIVTGEGVDQCLAVQVGSRTQGLRAASGAAFFQQPGRPEPDLVENKVAKARWFVFRG